MHDDTLSIGIIGAGIMGERLLSAILDQSPPLVKVSGVWDPAPSAMERMATTFPQVPRLTDAAAIIAASDCVYIASPPASHLGHARAALAAGRSVFCEKPLAVDVADARAFVAEAGERGAVNFPFASSLAVATLMGWIAQGAVGTASRITVEVSWQADAAAWLDGRQQGGFTREVVSHFLFLSRRLLGPLHGLSARAAFPETGTSERAIEARLMAGDIPVDLTGSVGTNLDAGRRPGCGAALRLVGRRAPPARRHMGARRRCAVAGGVAPDRAQAPDRGGGSAHAWPATSPRDPR